MGAKASEARIGMFTFYELAERSAERGFGVLVGWQRRADRSMTVHPSDASAGLILNPADKAALLIWEPHDTLLVLQNAAGAAKGHDQLEA